MSESTGYIRFVGGPWHNRHECVRWRTAIAVDVAAPVPVAYLSADAPIVRLDIRREVYQLTPMQSASGSLYLEYHADREHEHSGEDFVCEIGDGLDHLFTIELLRVMRKHGMHFRGFLADALNQCVQSPLAVLPPPTPTEVWAAFLLGVPLSNCGRGNMLGDGDRIHTPWSDPEAPIVDQLCAIDRAFLMTTGYPLRQVACAPHTWFLDILRNRQIKNLMKWGCPFQSNNIHHAKIHDCEFLIDDSAEVQRKFCGLPNETETLFASQMFDLTAEDPRYDAHGSAKILSPAGLAVLTTRF
jgi:hypothetical protein